MIEKEGSTAKMSKGSTNYRSGNWYRARWKPDIEGPTNGGHETREETWWVPNLWTADQAAAFAVGLLGREDLPPRMVQEQRTKERGIQRRTGIIYNHAEIRIHPTIKTPAERPKEIIGGTDKDPGCWKLVDTGHGFTFRFLASADEDDWTE